MESLEDEVWRAGCRISRIGYEESVVKESLLQ
jgi:hypothetical protein